MTKYVAGIFNALILVFDWVGIHKHDSILHWFMTITPQQIIVHLILCIVLLVYGLFPQVRYRLSQIPLLFIGLALVTAGLVGIVSPDYFGHRTNLMLVVDLFFCIESGVLVMLVALELPIRHIHLRKSPQRFYALDPKTDATSPSLTASSSS